MKHKSCSSLAAAERHGKNRDRLKHLTHPERSNENLFFRKYKDLTLVQAWKKETEGVKIRKNSVYMLEIVATYSPEASLYMDSKKTEFIQACMNWAAKEFGKSNILQARYDADESTGHCHLYICPLTTDGRLCCREFIGNKKLLSQKQNSYAEAMSAFGLERGKCYLGEEKEDKPRHKTLKEYYKEIEASRTIPKIIKLQNELTSR